MIKERIVKLIELKGIPKEAFYKEIGMTSASFRGSARETPLNSNAIENILSIIPDVNAYWLLTGKGDMFKPSITDGSHKAKESKKPVAHQTDNPAGIPLIGMEVAAGFGSATFAIKEEDIQNRYLVPDFNEIDFMIRVKGNSMYPKYSSGDIIACRIIRESKFIQWNKCYVIATTEQGLLVKRLRKGTQNNYLLVVSDNKEYEPFEIPTNEITGIALVIGAIRME